MITALRRCTAAAVTFALAGAPLHALAQSSPPAAEPADDAVAQAAAHYARGVKLYQEDDFRAANIEFSRAYELAPNWAVLYNLGQAQYQLREYPSALKTLERYVREGGDAIAPDRRAQVDREITELRGRVARVTAVSNVDGADIALDDAPVAKTPTTEPIVVGEGRHRLTISRSGYVTTTRVVDIAGGDALTMRLDLIPEAPAGTPAHESPNYTGAVVGGLFAVAGIAVGTVFGVLAMNDKSALNQACNSDKICPSSSQSDINGLSRNGAISTVGFGVGAAGLLVGGYFFFHERSKEDSSAAPRQSGARITPWIGPGAGGIGGTF
jgi:PEGA domain